MRSGRVSIAKQVVIVGNSQGLRKGLFIITGIVFNVHTCAIRELFRSNEVLAPDFQAVQSELPRGFVDQSFDVLHRFRSASTAIGTCGDGIGKYRHHLDMDVRDLIATRSHGHHALGWAGRIGLQISAQVGNHTNLQSKHGTVPLEGQLGRQVLVATLNHRKKILASSGDPLDRTTQFERQITGQHILTVNGPFAAESSPNVRCDQPYLVFGKAHCQG